jgi:hypothetical protein
MAPDNQTALKLVALDPEDLAILSAHLQDAIAKVGDIAYLPKEKRFAMLLNRFDWAGSERNPPVRRRTGIHFERVLAAKTRGIDLATPDAIVNLLAVEFEEKERPSGIVTLFFSGDADIGPHWPARKRPRHHEA